MILIDGKEWRPISFVEELIRAILAGMKTETRRIIRIDPQWSFPNPARYVDGFIYRWGQSAANDQKPERIACPYGKAGDRLWIRERFVAMKRNGEVCKIDEADAVVYRNGAGKWRDGTTFQAQQIPARWKPNTWRPPMHLPFWAHRIGLDVKAVKVERLQQITEAGAVREGFQRLKLNMSTNVSARDQFHDKWDVINGKRKDHYSGKPLVWEFNPLVWVVNFERLKT